MFNDTRLAILYFGFNLGLELLLKKLTRPQERRAFEKIVLLMEKQDEKKNKTEDEIKVQNLIDDLVKQWPEAEIPYASFVLADATPNAFAFPGG